MHKKKFIITGLILVWGVLGYVVYDFMKVEEIEIPNPVKKIQQELAPNKKTNTVFKDRDIINVLLVGTDTSQGRRNRGQGGFNTDTMILISANPETNVVLFTSVPRDLWINGNKINALYTVYGEETLVDAYEQVTGLTIDGVIRADFDNFTWIVDSFGGVPVDVQRTFSDYNFPNNNDSGPISVTFVEGEEVMSGNRALTFARSRKGTNGEGSDLMRAKRQHLILQGMVKAISQPESIFWPMDVEKFYNLVTAPGKMYTTLTLSDVKYLWDFYEDHDLYTVESLVVDGEYVYHPGMYPQSSYTAWVFVAKEPGFANLHKDIQNILNKVVIDELEQPQNGQLEPSQNL